MNKIPFTKMHGTGNDFMILHENDILRLQVNITKEFVQKICNRNFGIGSDGLLIVSSSDIADFKYNMYNPDGSQAEMCGNGVRCYMKYLLDNKLTSKNKIDIETLIGILSVEFRDDLYIVNMGEPKVIPELKLTSESLGDKFEIEASDRKFEFTPVSMGNPHCVIFLNGENLEYFNLEKYGKTIENDTEIFPNRTNVEFIEVISGTEINMRVWERGASETLACGTGACGSVVAGILGGKLARDEFVKVNLKGGVLHVKWSGNASDPVIMKGPAETTFEGFYYLNN